MNIIMYEKGTAEKQARKNVCFLCSMNIPVILFFILFFCFSSIRINMYYFYNKQNRSEKIGLEFHLN